jgi:2-dehydro-3-deoxyphosphogalactonate aldolase
MKMTNIEIFLIATPPPHAGGKVWYVIKIFTDEGIFGLGESMPHHIFTSIEKSYKKLAEDIFEKWYKGKDPLEREKIFKDVYSELCAGHPDIIGLSIVSAFDIAMWDICGKAVDLPVYQLLGGKIRNRVRSYSYISYGKPNKKVHGNYGSIWGDPEILCERAIQMVNEGFVALKYDPLEYTRTQEEKNRGEKFYNPYHLSAEDYRVTEITMDALKNTVGSKCDIILGTHGQMTTASAISYSKLLEKYSPLWFEEPIPYENIKELAKVCKSTSIPIAFGEHITTVYEFLRALEEGAVSIIQPDVGNCGGITQAKKIAAIAEAYYVDVAPHVWGGPVLTAAAVQLSMCIPNFLIMESILKSQDFHKEITTEFVEWRNGYIYPSNRSGLGIGLDEKFVRSHLL